VQAPMSGEDDPGGNQAIRLNATCLYAAGAVGEPGVMARQLTQRLPEIC
jgi:hypothetical protein